MGTKLKVTNLSNNKIVYVEVNDRMPRASGHVIDLTTAGAKQIGINGLGHVHLDVIENGVFNNVMNGEISKVLISANPLLSESQALSIANQYTVATSNTESNSQTTKDATN
jgi:rare lipoprotein A